MRTGSIAIREVPSAYNFEKQDITSIDEATDVAVAPPDLLLLVKSNNTILVKDLSLPNDTGYAVPTIDQAVKIIYSLQGNYIATLENKITRNGTKVSYVRVYVNWETLKNSKDTFPLRARIAGRVTPLSQSQQGLEMIEIPVQHMPDNLASCSISGNLLLLSGNVLTVYSFVTQTHDISKIHFIDFKQLPVDLHLPFTPLRLQIVENVVAVQNDKFLYVFQIKSVLPMCSLSDKEFSIDDFESIQNSRPKSVKEHKTINYEKLVKEHEEIKFSSNVNNANDIPRTICESTDSGESEVSKINPLSFPFVNEFPTIALENSLKSSRFPVLQPNPLLTRHNLTINLVTNSSRPNCSKNEYKIKNLCQCCLAPITVRGVCGSEFSEKFNILILKPFYSNDENEITAKQRLLESEYYKNLKCIVCFFGTPHEGFLSCFEVESIEKQENVFWENYSTYLFINPVIEVQLSDYFLYAISESDLTTCTLRAAKHLLKRTDFEECPSSEDPVCRIGRHPFVNIRRSLIRNNYLILFASNEESSWTLYQLKIPGAASVWKDFLSTGNKKIWECPPAYIALLSEGHIILKTSLNILKWTNCKDSTKNQLSLAKPIFYEEETDVIRSLYKESCALLGDYHILNLNFKSSYRYYTMSSIKIMDIVKRVRGLWENIPENYRGKYDEKKIIQGLIFFLKKTLSYYDKKYSEFAGNKEEFFSPEIGNLMSSLMDLLEKEENGSISDVVLESAVLREFGTDRILKMLKSLLSKKSDTQDKDALSLALMCIQRDQSDQAKTVLLTMKSSNLEDLLLQYYVLLFASHSAVGTNMFTELSMVLIETHPCVLANVLSNLVTVKKLLSLSKVLNFFMDLMSSGGVPTKNSSIVLQVFLENSLKYYAKNFTSREFRNKTTEAVKILIRIYLMQSQANSGSDMSNEEDSSEILFFENRWNYLNKVPPFDYEFDQITSNSTAENLSGTQKTILLKIQSLLSFYESQNEYFTEVRDFLSEHPNTCGYSSLLVLSTQNIQEAIILLSDIAPRSLTYFSEERIVEKDDWKFLVDHLHKKVCEASENSRLRFYLENILSDILRGIAKNMNIEDLVDILPKDYEDAKKYLAIARKSAQANHIKTLINITGKQLLSSL